MAEITKDMIGCLCEFSDFSGTHKELDILEDIKGVGLLMGYKQKNRGYWSPRCKPVEPHNIKFYERLYDGLSEVELLRKEIIEFTQKIHKLESDIKIANKNAQHWFDVAKEKSAENVQLLKKIEELKPKNKGEMYISVMDYSYKTVDGKTKRYKYYQFKPFGEYIGQFPTFEEALKFKKKWMKENGYTDE